MTQTYAGQTRHYLPWIMWLFTALFYFSNLMLRVIPSLISGELLQSLAITPIDLAEIISIYYLAYTALQIPIGVIVDRYGVRKSLTFGSATCCVAMLMIVHLNSFPLMLLSRVLLALGSTFAFVGSMKIVRVKLPEKYIGLLSSLTGAIGMLGASASFLMLTPLIDSYSWPVVAIILFGFMAILTMILFLLLPKASGTPAETDQTILRVFAGVWPLLRDHPLLLMNGVVACLCALPTTVFADLWANAFFHFAWNFSTLEAAKATSLLFLGWAAGSPVFGYVADYIKNYHLPLLVGVVGILMSFMAIVTLQPDSFFGLALICFILGFFSSCQSLVYPIACQFCPVSMTGTTIAFTNACIIIGSVLFQPIIAYLINRSDLNNALSGSMAYSLSSYQVALSPLVYATLFCCVLIYLQNRWSTVRVSAVA